MRKWRFCKIAICSDIKRVQSQDPNPGLWVNCTHSAIASLFLNPWNVRKMISWLVTARGAWEGSEKWWPPACFLPQLRTWPPGADLSWETGEPHVWSTPVYGSIKYIALLLKFLLKSDVNTQNKRIGVQPGIRFSDLTGPSPEWTDLWQLPVLVSVVGRGKQQ